LVKDRRLVSITAIAAIRASAFAKSIRLTGHGLAGGANGVIMSAHDSRGDFATMGSSAGGIAASSSHAVCEIISKPICFVCITINDGG
jgi:hypothetical protein